MADYTPINVDTVTGQSAEPVDIDTGIGPAPVTPEAAAERAAKATFGLNDITKKTYDDYNSAISNGQEDSMRSEAAVILANKRWQDFQRRSASFIGPVEWNAAINHLQTPIDTRSIFESAYTSKWLSNINTLNALKDIQGLSEDTMNYREYAIKRTQDIQDLVNSQSDLKTVWDNLKMMAPLYPDYNLFDRQTFSGGLGESEQKMMQEYLKLPFDQFKDKLDQDIQNDLNGVSGGNPLLALKRLNYLTGVSIDDTAMDNAFTLLSFADYAAAAMGTAKVTKAAFLRNKAMRAARSAIQTSSAVPTRSPDVAAEAAAGNLDRAAVKQTAQDANNTVQGTANPVVETKNGLTSWMKLDRNKAASNPGNFGADLSNRITEDYDRFINNFQNAMENLARPNRTPGFLDNPDIVDVAGNNVKAVEAYKETLKDKFTGTRNHVINIEGPTRDPYTNMRSFDIIFGKEDATLWDHPSSLNSWARENGFVPRDEFLHDEINRQFGIESSKLDKQIRDLHAQIKEGPAMDADVNELNRHDAMQKQLGALREKYEALLAWHAEKLTEPPVVMKETPGGYTVHRVEVPKKEPTPQQLAAEARVNQFKAIEKKLEAELNKAKNDSDIVAIQNRLDAVKDTRAVAEGDLARYTIHQDGEKWFMRVRVPFQETHNYVRDALMLTPNAAVPRSFGKDYIGHIRTPEDTLSMYHRRNRKIVDYNVDALRQVLFDSAQNIVQLAKGEVKFDPVTGEKTNFFARKGKAFLNTSLGIGSKYPDWLRIVDFGRYAIDPVTGQPGRYFETPYDLSHVYQTLLNRPPEPLEVRAYYDFMRIMQGDHALRELTIYKYMHRQGVMDHRLWAIDPNTGEKVYTTWMKARTLDKLPGGEGFTMVVMGPKWGDEQIVRTEHMAPNQREAWTKRIESGRGRMLELWNSGYREMEGMGNVGNQRVRYILTYNNPETKEMQLGDGSILPRRGGGHIQYNYDWWIKQADVRPEEVGGSIIHNYEGDTPYAPMKDRFRAKQVAQHLNTIREHLSAGREQDAKLHALAHIPEDWDSFRAKFNPTKNLATGKVSPPLYNMKEPFQVLRDGELIGNVDNDIRNRYTYRHPQSGETKTTFKDRTRGGDMARQFQVEFTEPRDADIIRTINQYGSKGAPKGMWEPAEMVDPMTTLARAINRITSSAFMDDYKMYGVEHWLRRAAPHLNLHDNPESELRSMPYSIFYRHEYLPNTKANIMNSLADEHYKIKSFIGIPSKLQSTLQQISYDMADYTMGGKRVLLAPAWALSNVADSATFARSIAHSVTMGFGSLPQIISQNMNYVTMLGMTNPRQAAKAVIGATLHQFNRLAGRFTDIDKLDFFDKLANGTGLYKPGEWKEANQTMVNRTSFHHVGAENVFLDHSPPKLITNQLGHYISAGDIIFKGSERNARFGAWYLAQSELRDRIPVGRLTDDHVAEILNRADELNGSMSKSSKSRLQTGYGAFPMQMLGYNMRLAELMLGTRLTPMRKLAVATTFALVFGLPSPLSMGVFPAGDYLRQYALENGYIVGDRFWSSLIYEGVPSSFMAMASGTGSWLDFQRDEQGNLINKRMRSGHFPNFAQRFGSPGMDMIRQALSGDAKVQDLMFGVTGSVFKQAVAQTAGIRMAFIDEFVDPKDREKYKVKPQDLLDPLKILSSYSYAWRTGAAMDTGKWLSRNETVLAQNVSPLRAFLLGLTGMQPQEAADTLYKGLSIHDWEARQKFAMDEGIKEYRRYIQALDNKQADAADYYRRSKAWQIVGGLSDENIKKMYRIASQGYEDMIQRVDNNMFGDPRKVMNETSYWNQLTGGGDRRDTARDMVHRTSILRQERGDR